MIGGEIDGLRPGDNRPMRAVRTGPPVMTRRMRPRKPLMKKQLNKQPPKLPEEQVIQQHQDGLHSLRRMGAAGFPEVNGNSSGRTTPPCRCRAASSPIRTSRTRRQGSMCTLVQCQAPVALAVLEALMKRDLAVLEAVVAEAAVEGIGINTMPSAVAGRAKARLQDAELYLNNPIAEKENRLGDLYKLKLPDRSGCRMLRTRARTGR